MKLVLDHVIAPKSAFAFEVAEGRHLRVIDIAGQQCSDLAIFNKQNPREKLSPSYSRTRRIPKPGDIHRPIDKLMPGDYLRSTIARPLMLIEDETAEPKGIHDSYIRMCNRMLYESFGLPPQDGCMELIARAVAPYGITAEDLPDPYNLFLNLQHDCEKHQWTIGAPVTKPGDWIQFRAEMDCLVAVSSCPEDQLTECNGSGCTPIGIQVYED